MKFKYGKTVVWVFPRSLLVSAAVCLLGLGLNLFATSEATAAELKTTFHVEEATISDIQKAILAKKLTTTELVKLYLARIKAYNGPGVEEPEGILGPIKPIPNSKMINALITLNLRPATRKPMWFHDRKPRTMTDALDNDPNMPDAFEVAAKLDAEFS